MIRGWGWAEGRGTRNATKNRVRGEGTPRKRGEGRGHAAGRGREGTREESDILYDNSSLLLGQH